MLGHVLEFFIVTILDQLYYHFWGLPGWRWVQVRIAALHGWTSADTTNALDSFSFGSIHATKLVSLLTVSLYEQGKWNQQQLVQFSIVLIVPFNAILFQFLVAREESPQHGVKVLGFQVWNVFWFSIINGSIQVGIRTISFLNFGPVVVTPGQYVSCIHMTRLTDVLFCLLLFANGSLDQSKIPPSPLLVPDVALEHAQRELQYLNWVVLIVSCHTSIQVEDEGAQHSSPPTVGVGSGSY